MSERRSKGLVIVESPSKARTINKYLGKEYQVIASVGHVKDLPESRFGVDIEKNFQPHYVVIKGKKKILEQIKKAAHTASRIYLAPDPDREGEAIAWLIAEELDGEKKRIYRILIHEITEKGIRQAMGNPGRIDLNKVNAQQARRVLDRIVGYTISPLLWDKVRRGLSAGRVQSVAVRLICEREKEIASFIPEEYWSITATLQKGDGPPFSAKLTRLAEEEIVIATGERAEEVVAQCAGRDFTVTAVEKGQKRRFPSPPFTTSKLQQEAARKLRFTPSKTMKIAQGLYEGVELGPEGPAGLITYMRTDSTRLAPEAQAEARTLVTERFGGGYLPDSPPLYKNKKGAQDAHEAIRPTDPFRTPEILADLLSEDHWQLYKLIWTRFMSSQMAPSLFESTRVEISAGDALFRATGTVLLFPGFMAVYTEGRDEDEEEEGGLPPLHAGDQLALRSLDPAQHFTQPPPRYTEATLIKELEEKGIGRPSTYHTILSTVLERKYVEKDNGHFRPTELGDVVNGLLVQHFPDVLSVEFTAKMEEQLDEIAEGGKEWVRTVREFYDPFNERLDKAKKEMRDIKREEIPTEIVCERCGLKMVIRWGKNGRFLACSGYPACRNTKEFEETDSGEIKVVNREIIVGGVCDQCGSPLMIKSGKFGRFLACSAYPSCTYTKPLGTGVTCPEPGCGGELIEKQTKRKRVFYGCSRYPTCQFALWEKPLARPCPSCGAPFLIEKKDAHKGRVISCQNRNCGYRDLSSHAF